MLALLMAALVLHHIEGVCKPKSPATLLRERYLEYIAQRDMQAAIERARKRGEKRRQAARDRAEVIRQARADRNGNTGQSSGRPQPRDVESLEPPQPHPDLQQFNVETRDAEQHCREG